MSKLQDFKKNAIKAGQATLLTGMLVGGILGGKQEAKNTENANKSTTTSEQQNQKVSKVVIIKEKPIKEMMWLDESNLIINGEILSNEDACAKYPRQAENIKRFADACLREKEHEYDMIDQIPASEGKKLSPEMEKEIENRLQNFNIVDYL